MIYIYTNKPYISSPCCLHCFLSICRIWATVELIVVMFLNVRVLRLDWENERSLLLYLDRQREAQIPQIKLSKSNFYLLLTFLMLCCIFCKLLLAWESSEKCDFKPINYYYYCQSAPIINKWTKAYYAPQCEDETCLYVLCYAVIWHVITWRNWNKKTM